MICIHGEEVMKANWAFLLKLRLLQLQNTSKISLDSKFHTLHVELFIH